jgi:DNA-binding NarL/FixJ family response regulator
MRAPAPIRVFLADDHAIVRHGLRQLLSTDDGITVVGEAADGAFVLNAPLDQVDVLVLDLSLPRYSGIEVLRRLRERFPALRTIVLSMYPADQYEARCLAEGAAAYVPKARPAESLLDTVRQVAAGITVTSAEERLAGPADGPAALHESLTAREYQVFALLAEGRKVHEIAVEIDVQPSTVSNHVARIKQKLCVDSIGEIVAYAHRAGLVE